LSIELFRVSVVLVVTLVLGRNNTVWQVPGGDMPTLCPIQFRHKDRHIDCRSYPCSADHHSVQKGPT
jgi:hypothetical protein